jgi:hypothetical protein
VKLGLSGLTQPVGGLLRGARPAGKQNTKPTAMFRYWATNLYTGMDWWKTKRSTVKCNTVRGVRSMQQLSQCIANGGATPYKTLPMYTCLVQGAQHRRPC